MADAAGKMQQVLELLSKFSLNSLDSEWTKSVIDADFTEVGDLPSNFEEHHFSTNLSGLFSAVNNSFRHWVDLLPNLTDDNHRMSNSTLTAEDDDDRLHTRFWTELSDDLKKLMTLLFYYCYRGQRYDAREAEREFGIQAASLYFLVLCVPGSNAFRVFHPVMYRKCMETMRLATKLQVGAASPKKGRHSTTARASQRRHQEDQMNTEAEEEEESEATMLTPSEATKLVRSLNVLLHDFLRLTVRFSLKHSPESLDETISILIEVSCSETNNAAGIFVERHGPATTTALAYNSYCSLQSLCCTIHGQKKKIVLLIMKHILHNILMVPRGLSDLSGRSLNVIREHSQIFVKYILMQVKEEAYDGVYILIQHLCLQVPDKAEFRQKAAQSVVEILRFLPTHLYVRLIKWFFKFSHNEKAGHRLFMLEVISKMLGEVERSAEGSQKNLEEVVQPRRLSTDTEYQENENSDEEQVEGENSFCAVPVDHPVEIPHDRKLLSHKFLLSIIFSRCRDSAASVRSKALTLLAECTLSTNRTIMLAMQQIFVNNKPLMFTTPHITSNNINLESPVQENEEVEEEELKFPNASLVVSMLRRRALDDKVTVRKSALQVLENLMKLHNDMLTHQNLAVLAEHCRDPALLIRKQMVVSLTTLLEHYPEHDGITTTWIKAVLPLILDPEVKVQERVIEGVDQLLFQRLLPAGHAQEHTPGNLLPWNILTTLTKCSYHKFFNKVLLHWSKMDNSRFQVVNIVKCHIGQEHNEEAWTLLAMLSGYITIKNVAFAVDYFEQHCQNTAEVGSYTLLQVLKVLSNSMKHVPADRAEDLHQQLLLPLSSFSVGAELISSMMDAVTLLTYTLHGDDIESQKAIEKWVAPILKACDEHLKEVLFQRTDPLDAAREEKLYRYLFTMGEAAMLCPQKVNKRMFLMLQSLIFHQQGQEEDDSLPTVPSTQTQCSQPTTITFTPTIRLKALSVVTLGKMCLQHEEQAKRIIPALSRLLSATTHPAIKNNILFTLTDMCVRYATLVDPLMDRVTACLRDPHPQVHRTALTLLISLLQEDYLKLKGSFFYRILQCLTEKDEEMREMVIFYITERLLKRFPKILCQHFIECIFHYNCYEDHETYNRFSQSNLEKEVFSLAGREHSHERHIIYHFMLDHMPDDQRFMTTQRLCQDVLGAVVDGRIKLNKSSMPMLEDTLTILRSDEIKLASLKSRPEDTDQPTDQAEQAVMAGMVIKKTIISQVVKQNVIENIVPILIAVKHKLEEQRSPLMKHLLLYLKELMKDYKNEVREILAGDKQLAKEIEFDLRRFDKEQWEEKNQREENDQRIPSREISNKGSNHDTLGSSPVLRERRLSVVEEQDTSRPSTTCLPPPANIKELHTRAQVFSKDATARRKSVSVAGCVDGIREPTKLLQATVRLRRISIADFREHSCDVFPTREETTHVDPRAIGGYLPQEEEGEEEPNEKEEAMKERMEGEEETVESAKDESREGPIKNKTRSELLRAISTPSTERTLINNLTFVNETQELSAININSTVASEKSNAGELQLHSTSPTSHKHESDFSRLRKTSKDMQQDPIESSKDKAKGKKKVTGQLFESFEAESSRSEAESTCESDVSAVTAQSAVKRNEGKRTRHVASLSPDPEKNKSNTQTERPKLKKHKKKT